jgi:cbb3-type cytochrome oxidase subunit 3
MLPLILEKTKPADTGINWDALTAIGTLALAIVTLLTLAYAVWATGRERRQAASDREDAEKRLEDERQAGAQRLRDEREHAAEVRRRDRQIDNVAILVGRVAEMQAFIEKVPGTLLRANRPSMSGRLPADADEALRAINSLRHGAWTEATMLGTGEVAEEAAERYRTLVRLFDEASRIKTVTDHDLIALRYYCRWVVLTLRTLAEDETVPPLYPGAARRPEFGVTDYKLIWKPVPWPPGWQDIAGADPPIEVTINYVMPTGGTDAQAPKPGLVAE